MLTRKTFLDAVTAVEPALATKDLVPILVCVCFDGTNVYAYDDAVALVTPLKTEFKGGVRGEVLRTWLDSVGAKEIKVEAAKSELSMSAGRSRLKLALVPESDFLLELPTKFKDVVEIPLNESFLDALRGAAMSTGTDPGHPWRMGVTACFGKKQVIVYGCDDLTATRAVGIVKVPEGLTGQAVIFPPRFAALLNAKADKTSVLRIAKGWMSVSLPGGVTLYTKRLGDVTPKMFEELCGGVKAAEEAAIPLPKRWTGFMKHSLSLLKGQSEPHAKIIVKDNKITIVTETKLGVGHDSEDCAKPHPDVEAVFVPEFVVRADGLVDRFYVQGSQVLYLMGDGVTYFMSLSAK